MDNRDLFARLPNESIDLILTDPPYKTYRSNRPVAHEKLKTVDAGLFDIDIFAAQSHRVLKQGAHLYCFCDHQTFPDIRQKLIDKEFKYKNCLVWVKNNHGSGDLKGNWAPQHEFIIFATKGQGKPLQGKRKSNVLLKRADNGGFEFFNKVSNYKYHHGTTKPVELLRLLISASSREGDVVLDPYGGSGSTAEACLLENRRFILAEIDSEYVERAKNRIAKLEENSI
ncbi:site-specific DNA-methyltransferase [candidate division LCP-89 bacterium B3_LCP]|uniref:Methyltransferase n=1 Tax=candidate division LCP-89 bacterium B3_LCP TaxID=2012998 RepID=A0A532UWE3_UNCL8|nr:MAG: site-specific DNA-methyltransferase [candidate division LCP-89 bacterium B3_LCP]